MIFLRYNDKNPAIALAAGQKITRDIRSWCIDISRSPTSYIEGHNIPFDNFRYCLPEMHLTASLGLNPTSVRSCMTCIYSTITGGLIQPFFLDFARFFRAFSKP